MMMNNVAAAAALCCVSFALNACHYVHVSRLSSTPAIVIADNGKENRK